MKTSMLVTAICLTALFSCSHLPSKPSPEQLEKIVQTHWQLKQDGKWDEVYDFYCKDFKSEVTRINFIKRSNLNIEAFKVNDVSMSSDQKQAWVSVSFESVIQGFRFSEMKIKENWRYEDNDWCISKKNAVNELFKK